MDFTFLIHQSYTGYDTAALPDTDVYGDWREYPLIHLSFVNTECGSMHVDLRHTHLLLHLRKETFCIKSNIGFLEIAGVSLALNLY